MSVHYVPGVILEFVFWTLTDRLFRFCGPCLFSLRVSVAMARAAAPKKKEVLRQVHSSSDFRYGSRLSALPVCTTILLIAARSKVI